MPDIVTIAVISAVCFGAGALIMFRLIKRKSINRFSIWSGVKHMKSIGHLSVFKVYTKEIVTGIDHTWGEFGRKYLTWLISEKKMAMIFEFEIDFRYDLRSSDFKITMNDTMNNNGKYLIHMPYCLYEIHITNISFYDEQQSKLLPWLLPELISKFSAGRFSEEDKNRMVVAARENAKTQAIKLIHNIENEVQNSAIATLRALCHSFEVTDPEFRFKTMNEENLTVVRGLAGTQSCLTEIVTPSN
jgi:hypothetical protein